MPAGVRRSSPKKWRPVRYCSGSLCTGCGKPRFPRFLEGFVAVERSGATWCFALRVFLKRFFLVHAGRLSSSISFYLVFFGCHRCAELQESIECLRSLFRFYFPVECLLFCLTGCATVDVNNSVNTFFIFFLVVFRCCSSSSSCSISSFHV